MIYLRQVSLHRGTKLLLDEANLALFDRQKVGIVGPNGAGKSSLFQCFLGNIATDHGEVDIPNRCRLAHLEQELPACEDSAIDYALLGDREYAKLQAELNAAEASGDGLKIAEVHAHLAEIEGYSAPSRAAKILCGLGFAQAQLSRKVTDFSGGWRMRLNLAQVLLSRADVLLLDEPTNHLDLEGIVWLADWIKNANCMVLVISHDREFLDDVATHIVHFDEAKLTSYTGNYSRFEKEYAAQLMMQQAAHTKQQAQKAHLQKFIDRFKAKASKAKQAQSRVKMLERMQDVAAVQMKNPFRFQFAEAPSGINPMLALNNVSVGYAEKPVLNKLNISLSDGDRVGLLGLNGAGKSTLIKLLSGDLKPLTGEMVCSSKLKVSYFAQHQLDQLDSDASMMTHLRRVDKKVSDADARKFFGGFNFRGDRVFEPVGNFSGGEKARLVLSLIVWQKPNLLLMDEPTNHLDMEMREALVIALQNFQGALVLVSHDRYLLSSLVDDYYLIDKARVERFDGDMQNYREWLKDREEVVDISEPVTKLKQGKVNKLSTEQLEKRLLRLEKELEKFQAKLADVEQMLCDNDIYQPENADRLQQLQRRQTKAKEKIAKIEADILAVIDQS